MGSMYELGRVQAKDLDSVEVGATAVRLSADQNLHLEAAWTVRADPANPGTIYIGGPNVRPPGTNGPTDKGAGIPLEPGESLDPRLLWPYHVWARATAAACVLHQHGG